MTDDVEEDKAPLFALIDAASRAVTLIAPRIDADVQAWVAGEMRLLSPSVNDSFVMPVDADVRVGMLLEANGSFQQPAPPMPTQADYIAALEAMYDAKAHERRYDNRYTCALRAGYAGPFQAEAQAFALWMDQCNAQAYQVLEQVQRGKENAPTIAGLLAMMPALIWPVLTLNGGTLPSGDMPSASAGNEFA